MMIGLPPAPRFRLCPLSLSLFSRRTRHPRGSWADAVRDARDEAHAHAHAHARASRGRARELARDIRLAEAQAESAEAHARASAAYADIVRGRLNKLLQDARAEGVPPWGELVFPLPEGAAAPPPPRPGRSFSRAWWAGVTL